MDREISKETCRVCLTQRRSLRSVFQPVGLCTYAEIICLISNVKIQNNDGFSEKICSICRRKAEEAYEFKNLVETSDHKLRGLVFLKNEVSPKKIIFNDLNDLKVEIDYIKSENNVEEKSNLKLNSEGETIYNNVIIKKCIKVEAKEITFEEFVNDNDIKYEIPTQFEDDHEVDNMDLNNDGDEDYTPLSLKKTKTGAFKNKRRRGRPRKLKPEIKTIIEPIFRDNIVEEEASKVKFTKLIPKVLNNLRVVRELTSPGKLKRKAKTKQKENCVCPYCGKQCTNMDIHLQIHIGDRKYKCTKCPKSYCLRSSLLAHVQVHSETKDYQCDICRAKFFKKGLLKSHLEMHKEIRDHICTICSKGFKRKSGLTRHKARHSSANKVINCELCNMSFFEKFQLMHHMRIHTGERPYKCELCAQPYSYKHDFNRHCFKKHGVYMKQRTVRVMNQEVLEKERLDVKTMLETQGTIEIPTPANQYPRIMDAAQLNILFNT